MAIILPVPESEQRVLDNLLRDLYETYPDMVIVRLQQDHKKWSEKVTRLYKNIGYASRDEFLAAYGFTVEQGKTGRPSNDINAVVEELISRYPGDKCVTSLEQLKEENPDLAPKIKSIQNKAKDRFGMSFNNYLKEKGVFQSDKSAAEERSKEYQAKIAVMIDELKRRYEDKELPKTITEVKESNSDIENIANIGLWIERAYGRIPYDYLMEQGIIKEKEKKPEKTEEEKAASEFRKLSANQKLEIITEELKRRVDGGAEKIIAYSSFAAIKRLKELHSDLPVQTMNAWTKQVLNKDVYVYLVEQGIAKSVREVCIERIKPYNSISSKYGILLEKSDPAIMRMLQENNLWCMRGIPPMGKGYYFVLDTDDETAFGGEFWEQPLNKQLQDKLIDSASKVKYISRKNILELLSEKDKHAEMFEKEDRTAKCERAMKVLKSCVKKVEQYMDKTNDYNYPSAVGELGNRGKNTYSAANAQYASDFFDAVIQWMNKGDKGYDILFDTKDIRRWYEQTFTEMLQKNFWFEGEVGVRYPVGLAVAYLIYVNPKVPISIEFVRDKWELRGDYRSSKRVCLEVSDYGYDINVHYNYYDAYDM